jgi:hypothetical protein
MGYSANDAQLMSVPPYVCACVFTISASWYADRVRKRGIFMLGFQLVAIAGFSMLAANAKPRVQYAGTVLAAIGIYPQIPLGMAWNSANIGGSLKRGTGIAMQVWCLFVHRLKKTCTDTLDRSWAATAEALSLLTSTLAVMGLVTSRVIVF